MRKINIKWIISALIVVISICITNKIYATVSVTPTTQGQRVTAGEEKVLSVAVKSDENIGVVSGVISYSSNIESLKIEAKNNWNLTYNNQTGDFNIYKAEGATSEEIMQITILLKSDAKGTAKVTISDLDETTISYKTASLSDISKEFLIESKMLTMSGDSKVEAGKTQNVDVKLSSKEKIGVVKGKISYSSNIETITLEGANNWDLTYNKSTGDFVLNKASGATDEVIMKIKYKVKSGTKGNVTITLDSLIGSNIEYENLGIVKTSKTIAITSSNDSTKDENQDNNSDEKDNNSGEKDNNKETNNSSTTNKTNTINKNKTTANKKLPDTGTVSLIAIIAIAVTLGIIFYKKYNYYKDV